ncbi:MAG: hypothetical protein ACM31C_14255 [Acidobacteriota bacterium]
MIRPWWLAAVWLTCSTTALAQPAGAQAEVLFRRGRELMSAGQIAEACAAFEESQKLEAATTTLLNLAACREKHGQLATAWGLFLDAERQTRAATDDVGRQLHHTAADHARKLEPRLSKLTIHVPDSLRGDITDIRRDGAAIDPVVWNIALPIDGGTYHVVVRMRGAPDVSLAVTVANEGDAKTVEVPQPQGARPAEPARPASTPPPHAASAPAIWYCARSMIANLGTCKPTREACEAFHDAASAYMRDLTDCSQEASAYCFQAGGEDHCAPDRDACDHVQALASGRGGGASTCELRAARASRGDGDHARGRLPLIVTVTGGALLVGTTAFAISAVGTYNDAKAEMTSEPRRRSLYDSANTKLLTAQVLGAAGVGCIAAGVWLYLRHHDEPSTPPRAALALTPSGAMVVGSF